MALLKQIFPLHSLYLNEESNSGSLGDHKDALKTGLQYLGEQRYDRVVITGPDTADKTSLAFQAAVSAASTGLNVTYISTHPLNRLPVPVHGMPSPTADAMNNVTFLYLEECSGLLAWFASIHTKSSLPRLIVVEDILTYACQLNDNHQERSLARLCATITDSLEWISNTEKAAGCQVIMTAPSRITTLCPVLRQFSFKLVEYKGPSDGKDSELHFNNSKVDVQVKFKRHKDCLIVTNVDISKT